MAFTETTRQRKQFLIQPALGGPPQFNSSVEHKRATPFQPQNPSVQHQKPVSSTLNLDASYPIHGVLLLKS